MTHNTQPTAAGVRPGAADTLACAMPVELGVHNTGHDLTGLSALWEYLQARVALTIPGLVALAGWPTFPYGHLGKGPKHPTLAGLIGVSEERLEAMIDFTFSFEQGGQHPPMLLRDGHLRPMMRCVLATMIMYYQQRYEVRPREMQSVNDHLAEAYKATVGFPGEDAHQKLMEWSSIIKVQFDLDNLHLTARDGHDNTEKVVTAVKQLGSGQASMQGQLADVAARQVRIESKQDDLLMKLGNLSYTPSQPQPPVSPAAASISASAASHAATASSTSTSAPAPPSAASFAAAFSAIHSSRQPKGPQGAAFSAKKLNGGQFYLDCMARGGALHADVLADDKRKSDCEKVFKIFDAMTSSHEREALIDPNCDPRYATEIARLLTKLVLRRILDSYREHAIQIGSGVSTGSCYLDFFVQHVRDSKLLPSRAGFQAWRALPVGSASTSDQQRASSSSVGKRPAESPRLTAQKQQKPDYRESPDSEEEVAEGGGEEEEQGSEGEGGSAGESAHPSSGQTPDRPVVL